MAATNVSLLNASYEPLGNVSFQHAVRMLFREVATVEEPHGDRMIGPHPWPRVIRLVRYVAMTWMYRPAPWTRRGVLLRDGHRCAFCGGHATSVDHLVPRSRGGPDTYLNTVASCGACNQRKAAKTLTESGMRLLFAPWEPRRIDLTGWSTHQRSARTGMAESSHGREP